MGILFLDDNDMVFVDSLFCLSPTASVEVVVVFHFFVDAVFFIGQLVGAALQMVDEISQRLLPVL